MNKKCWISKLIFTPSILFAFKFSFLCPRSLAQTEFKKYRKFDENETEFIETDLVLNFYMQEYKNLRKQIIIKCSDIFSEK
jgi:hypothetical protein